MQGHCCPRCALRLRLWSSAVTQRHCRLFARSKLQGRRDEVVDLLEIQERLAMELLHAVVGEEEILKLVGIAVGHLPTPGVEVKAKSQVHVGEGYVCCRQPLRIDLSLAPE